MTLFARDQVVGIFRGFSQGGLEFHADLVLPYRSEFQSIPMHGQFLIVQLEDQNEAVLGRITSMSADGRLAQGQGEDYGLRVVAGEREIPEELREQYLKYRVNIRVLGVLRETGGKIVFAPSHRRLPHLGSRVAFLSPDLLREVAGHNMPGAELGFFALGEFIYAGGDRRLKPLDWMRVVEPTVVPRFPIHQLVSRRTFVFARAGFGKSNLNKLLFAGLYEETPTVTKRGGRQVPVGTIIFDPDGEYFWPDDKNRPGLCDVPHLQDRIVVFTNREAPSPFYQSFVAGGIKLDIRRLRPADVISIALSPEKQDQQNVRKLKGLNDAAWAQLVDAIDEDGNFTDLDLVKNLLGLEEGQEAEALAARANMTTIVKMLHDRSSQMLDMLLTALKRGCICVVDVSQLRGHSALVLSGLILNHIFQHNQEQFTRAEPDTIPTTAIIEEAQSVLGPSGGASAEPYIAWVKEGRKYDLGAVMITQQPGSIATEILSQGDNWFVFHLISAADLVALKKANSHFSDDLLASLLNEPIPGHCVFWSSSGGKPYPVPVRVFSFEERYQVLDPDGTRGPVQTFAQELRVTYAAVLRPGAEAAAARAASVTGRGGAAAGPEAGESSADSLREPLARAFVQVRADEELMEQLRTTGVPWGVLAGKIKEHLPVEWHDRDDRAYHNVQTFLTETFGPKNKNWKTEKRLTKDGTRKVTWVVVSGRAGSDAADR